MENSNLLSLQGQKPLADQEEVIIISPITQIVKQILKDKIIIWHDPNINSPENISRLRDLEAICDVQPFIDWKKAVDFLKNVQDSNCLIITSETNGELLFKEIWTLKYISPIYVFCEDRKAHKAWTDQYSKNVCTVDDFKSLLSKIKQKTEKLEKKSSSSRVNLPSFAPIFDDMNRSEVNYLHFYLKGLINFKNRQQAKRDFLALAKALFNETTNIEDFDKNYTQYDMRSIFYWYTRETFLYKLINKCLRVANSDSIQYCRLALKDLETAIKEKYQQESHSFSGQVYRGTYISNDEWAKLQQNIGRDIEMHGFLSTTKKKSVAVSFSMEDRDKKVFITIIVPNIPDKEIQGFAEVKEYSDNPEEDEVLFNVRSRFTILEATLEEIEGEKLRHLVLLYGAQAIRKINKLRYPTTLVEFYNTGLTQCKVCNQKIKIAKESMIAISIPGNEAYICERCIQKPGVAKRSLLFCISPAAHGICESMKTLIVEGRIMQYNDSTEIQFYGYKCKSCKTTKLDCCYNCMNCQDTKVMYCRKCFFNKQSNSCIKDGHMVILETCPFSFWPEKMSEGEFCELKYQEKILSEMSADFQQAQIFSETHEYNKAKECYQRLLVQTGSVKNENTATLYNHLAEAEYNLGEYQKAKEDYTKGLEISKEVLGDNHPRTAILYRNLAQTNSKSGEYSKAIEGYSKALELFKSLFGENHSQIAVSYGMLAKVYDNQGKHQEAISEYLKALPVFKAVHGDNHPNTAGCYTSLAEAQRSLGDFDEALKGHLEALRIDKAVLGDKHPETATAYNNVGLIYYDLGEYQTGIQHFLMAIKIKEAVQGKEHVSTAESYFNLAEAYCDDDKLEKAKDYYFRVMRIYETAYDKKSSKNAKLYSGLGKLYFKLKDDQKAVEYSTKALDLTEFLLGYRHLETALCYNDLALIKTHLGKYEEALRGYQKALEITKSIVGENHPSIATCYNNIALVYSKKDEDRKAVEYNLKSLEIFKTVYNNKHPHIAQVYSNLGEAYLDLEDYKEAIKAFSEAFEINNATLGKHHLETINAKQNLQLAKKWL